MAPPPSTALLAALIYSTFMLIDTSTALGSVRWPSLGAGIAASGAAAATAATATATGLSPPHLSRSTSLQRLVAAEGCSKFCACRHQHKRPLYRKVLGVSRGGSALYSGLPMPTDAGKSTWQEQLDEIYSKVPETLADAPSQPVIFQFAPKREELLLRWRGTIWEHTWRPTLINFTLSLLSCIAFRRLEGRYPGLSQQLVFIDRIWQVQMTLTIFVVTFFLQHSWNLWKDVYETMRAIQGRLNDLNLMLSTHATRGEDGALAGDNLEWLQQFGRYSRLWNVLFYASVSRKHACFASDAGLSVLESEGWVSPRELKLLTAKDAPAPSSRHVLVLQWMTTMFVQTGVPQKRFLMADTLHISFLDKVLTLRAKYGRLLDILAGRVKVAYPHAVQLLVDSFLLLTPFAMWSEVGYWSVLSTPILTFFFQGLFNLAKTFCDPLDNEAWHNSDNIRIDTLIAESTRGSKRWYSAVLRLPFLGEEEQDAKAEAEVVEGRSSIPEPIVNEVPAFAHDVVPPTPPTLSTAPSKEEEDASKEQLPDAPERERDLGPASATLYLAAL